MLMQEVHCTGDVINSWKTTCNGPSVFSVANAYKKKA